MVYQGTRLDVIDNSGARSVLCIKVLGKRAKGVANIGDRLIVVVKKRNPAKKIKAGSIWKALLVRDSKMTRRIDGSYIKFINPACVILKKDGSPYGKRIHGPVAKELRKLGHLKIISIASIAL